VPLRPYPTRYLFMEAFLSSTLAVAIAEIGDKTQLLALFLITRYGKPWPIVAGVLVATLVNHGLSAWLGAWLASFIPTAALPWLLAASFLAVGIWLLIPDKDDEPATAWAASNAFLATLVLFFLAEIGDKTQVATVLLAAKFSQTTWVILGTTLGMLLANVPIIFAGQWLMKKMPMALARKIAFGLFVGFALVALAAALY
jgi:Ca2+/H+ antiporter, TMEM165/GDT1 family